MSSSHQGIQVDIESRIKEITEMGFGEKQARDALSKFDNDLQQAITFLITSPSDVDPELEEAGN